MTGPTTLMNIAGPTPAPGGHAPGPGGQNGSPKASKRPLPHIDDIVNVVPEVDPHAPIDKLLQSAETYLNRAEASKDFGRPDIALKEYICAYTLVVDTIKRNPGWPSLQRHHQSQYSRYQQLVRKIVGLDPAFAHIKAEIKADNVRTGVQPFRGRATMSTLNGTYPAVQPPAEESGGTHRNGMTSPKAKPPVHPKPQALHGNSLPSTKGADDLAQRFARLRTAPAGTGQDTGAITQPLVPQKNAGFKFPSHTEQPAAAGAALATLPRVPEAIYNPPRGTVSNEAAKLPSSAPRTLFTRTNSASSIPSTNKIVNTTPTGEFFVPAQSFGSPAKRAKVSVSTLPTISAQDLVMYMQAGAKSMSILIIDIRSRELFDQGHIMSQATICLEAEVLRRKDISAAQISDSMVLSPASEQLLFERRLEFDMIVVYDEDSVEIPKTPITPEEQAVAGIFNALLRYDFSVGMREPTVVKLLQGGLLEWTRLVGKTGLQTSSSFPRKTYETPITRSLLEKPKSYIVPPLTDVGEIKKFEETLSRMARSKDEYLRSPHTRTPQSMTGHTKPPDGSAARATAFSFSGPPAPPPPIHHRASHSGLPDTHTSYLLAKKGVSGTAGGKPTGLINAGNTCFANSTLQALFATPGFASFLYKHQWESYYSKPPRLPEENVDNPQLLTRLMAGFFAMLSLKSHTAMHTGSLGDYIYQIHRRGRPLQSTFGGPHQQDAQEYLSFLLENIHDETNKNRDQPQTGIPEHMGAYVYTAGVDAWNRYRATSDSIVDKYFRHMGVNRLTCQNCNRTWCNFATQDVKFVTAPDGEGQTPLINLLTPKDEFIDYKCEKCEQKGVKGQVTKMEAISRISDRFVVCITRSAAGHDAAKVTTKVTWPITGFDLGPAILGNNANMIYPSDTPKEFQGPFTYDCYAVVVHDGKNHTSGHYWALVRDESNPKMWYRMNDTMVTPFNIDNHDNIGETNLYGNKGANPYLVFFQRRGT